MPTEPTAAAAPTKGARTRARILEAAAEHFAAVGFEGGSVPEIARRVGVSHATLYQHFGRKDELFRAAVEADLSALFATLHPALEDQIHDADSLVALLPQLALATGRHPLARRVLAEIDGEENAILRDSPALIDLERRVVAAIVRAQKARTIRRDIEATRFAAGLVALTLPLLVVALRLEGTVDIPRAPDALVFLTDLLRPPAHLQPGARRSTPTSTRSVTKSSSHTSRRTTS